MTDTPRDDLVLLAQPESGLATLTLNRPEAMNAMDLPMARAFQAACERIAQERSARVVVLSGAGRGFGAGGDLQSLHREPGRVGDLIDAMHRAIRILSTLDAPVLASLQGVVAGGSLSLSAACDLAIAAEGTKFNLAYANIGASCDLSGSWSLPRLVGLRRALEIALLSETFDAQEALRLGLVNRVVPAEALHEETMKIARRLAGGATLAYGRIRRLMRQSMEMPLDRQLDAERNAFLAGVQTQDFRDGVAAFLKKERPVFTGR